MRICSFLPSATEIVYALELGDHLAGVTHECDYPPEAQKKPVVVRTRLRDASSAAEIDRQVNEFMARGESLYQVDVEALRKIQPDLIITQDLCRVCAPSPGDLEDALTLLARAPQVLSLDPNCLADVWSDILTVGKAAGRAFQAEKLVRELQRRVGKVQDAVAGARERPRVACLEWLNPPFVAGHWVPEMVASAGGKDVLGRKSEPGFRVTWDVVFDARPEIVVIMPCGYHLEQAVEEARAMSFPAGWQDLPAVVNHRVFAVDASSYFSRPGPRLADGAEILACLFHPKRAPVKPPAGGIEQVNWSNRR